MVRKGENRVSENEAAVRLVCSIESASKHIDGIWFGKLGAVKVSEPIDASRAQRYLGVDGFKLWSGTDEELDQVDDNIAIVRRESPTGTIEPDVKAMIAGINAANKRMTDELVAANRKVETLEAENAKLRADVAAVKLGFRPVAPTIIDEEIQALQ